jgi:type IV pilus assembly protein PilV
MNPFRPNHLLRPYRGSFGFTLLEVLITVLVLSIGLLSLAALQGVALRDSHSSFQRTVATVQATDLVERMWAGRCDTTNFPDDIFEDWSDDPGVTGAANFLLQDWNASLDSVNAPTYRVRISWSDPRATDNTANPFFDHWFRVPNDSCPGGS